MQSCSTQTYDNTSENTHLQGSDSQYRGRSSFQKVLRPAMNIDHSADGSMHNKESDDCSQSCHFLFLLRHTDGNAHGEYQGQVIEHHISRGAHNGKNSVQDRSWSHNSH